MLCVAFVVASIIFIFRDRPSNSCDKYEEFSVDLKPNRKAKLYTTIWLVRRIAFAIIVVSLSPVSSFTVLLLMTIIQCLLYLIFIILVRPFSEPKDNTIEIINEIIFTFLVCWQFYFNSEQRWNNASTSIYIWTICLNNFIVFLIITVACIFSLIKTCKQKCSRFNALQSYLSKIHPEVNQSNQNIQNSEQQINHMRPITLNGENIEEIKIEVPENKTRIHIINAEFSHIGQ